MIFIDECGHSGPNLLDGGQPVFVLASVSKTEAECDELKARFFGGTQAPELKHKTLSRHPPGQAAVVALLDELRAEPSHVRLAFGHKKYILVCKMVDLLIEPAMHADGHNAYERGFNLALSNQLYFFLPTAIGQDKFIDTLQLFQALVREPTQVSYGAFQHHINALACEPQLQELVDWLKVGDIRLGRRFFLRHLSAENLDVANAFAAYLAFEWSATASEPITIVHDDSAAMRKHGTAWEKMLDPTLPTMELGYDRRKITFPLKIREIRTMSSHASSGVQIADVIAGACCRAMQFGSKGGSQDSDPYGAQLWERVADTFDSFPVWPQEKFTPDELGTTGPDAGDPIDYIGELLHR